MSLHKVLAHSRALFARNATVTRFAKGQVSRNNHVIATPPTERISLKVEKDEIKGKKSQLVSDEENQLVNDKKCRKSSVKLKKGFVEHHNCLKNTIRNFSSDSNKKDFLNLVGLETCSNAKGTKKGKCKTQKTEKEGTSNKSVNFELKDNLKTEKTKKVTTVKKKKRKTLVKKNRYKNKLKESIVVVKSSSKKDSGKVTKEIDRDFSLSNNKVLKLLFWNVAGLKKKSKRFWNFIKEMDVIGFSETWVSKRRWAGMKKKLPDKYDWICKFAIKSKRRGRPKGGILFGVRKEIPVANEDCITSSEILENKIILGNKTIRILTVYNSTSSSNYENELFWEILENEVNSNDFLMIGGDFNARTGNKGGMVLNGVQQERKSLDKVINKSGKKLLELCEKKKWIILNGNVEAGLGITFHRDGICTVIDYVIVNTKMLPFVKKFSVKSKFESDHEPLLVELNLKKLMIEENVSTVGGKKSNAIPKT